MKMAYQRLDFDDIENRTSVIDDLIAESTDDGRRRYLEDLAEWMTDAQASDKYTDKANDTYREAIREAIDTLEGAL